MMIDPTVQKFLEKEFNEEEIKLIQRTLVYQPESVVARMITKVANRIHQDGYDQGWEDGFYEEKN